MLTGGEHAEIPRGFIIDEPYDSLSFLPTVLALTGKLGDDMTPVGLMFFVLGSWFFVLLALALCP